MCACPSVCRQVVCLLGRCIRSWSTSTEDPTEWELETFSKVTSSRNMESSSSQSTTDSEFSVSYRCIDATHYTQLTPFPPDPYLYKCAQRSSCWQSMFCMPIYTENQRGQEDIVYMNRPIHYQNHICIYSKYTEKVTISVYPGEASLTETGLIRLLCVLHCRIGLPFPEERKGCCSGTSRRL